jgi:hypothetical protein
LSRNVISADAVVGRLTHDRPGVLLGVGGTLTDIGRSGVGNGREEGSVPAKYPDLILRVKRQREIVAVSCDDRPDEGRRGVRSTDRRV